MKIYIPLLYLNPWRLVMYSARMFHVYTIAWNFQGTKSFLSFSMKNNGEVFDTYLYDIYSMIFTFKKWVDSLKSIEWNGHYKVHPSLH